MWPLLYEWAGSRVNPIPNGRIVIFRGGCYDSEYEITESARHILVVDDDMLARMMAVQCVKQQGHSASMAKGGVQALEMLGSEKYDLVLLDLLMPDVDGFDVLAKIKEDPQIRDIPVVMVSGADEAESVAKCMELGASGHLPKPLDPVLLATQIDTYLQR